MYKLHRQGFRKVPEITAIFWLTKILTTAMGESTSDFFVFKINPYVAVILGGVALVIALILQFSVSKYIAWVYWFAVAMVAVFGTMVADVLHIQFGIPYLISTIFFAVVLALVFIVWYKSEKTLSIHTIYNSRRELFYWATVLATFALGTAAGDLTARTIGLGFFASGLLFTGIFVVPAIGYRLGLNKIFAFWFAYILTRPLGASFADWFGKSTRISGLGLGDGRVIIVLTVLIILCVAYMTFSHQEARHKNQNS
jgi:uncharacterized membrane-anchored protein